MRHWIVLFLVFYVFGVTAQDRILKKDFQEDDDPNVRVKIAGIQNNTLYYFEAGISKQIAVTDIVAIKEEYIDKTGDYIYLNPQDERIYGIKNDRLYFKADYRFTSSNPEFSKECFLAKFRIYGSVMPENTDNQLYIWSASEEEKVKIPENASFYIYVKGDELNRNIKARLYYTSNDTTEIVVKIKVNKTDYAYRFKNTDIKALGIESVGAHTGRTAINILSLGRSLQYHNNKWSTKYEFDTWHICH